MEKEGVREEKRKGGAVDELEAEEDSASRAVLFKSDLGRKCRVSGGLRHGIPSLSWIVYFFELYHRSWGCKTVFAVWLKEGGEDGGSDWTTCFRGGLVFWELLLG